MANLYYFRTYPSALFVLEDFVIDSGEEDEPLKTLDDIYRDNAEASMYIELCNKGFPKYAIRALNEKELMNVLKYFQEKTA